MGRGRTTPRGARRHRLSWYKPGAATRESGAADHMTPRGVRAREKMLASPLCDCVAWHHVWCDKCGYRYVAVVRTGVT